MSSTRWRPGRPAVAWICLTVTLIVLGGAIYAGWGAILERWYVYRLDSPDLEVRKHAIDKLGEKGSNKACLRLLEIARKDDVLGPRVVAALVRGRDVASPELLSILKRRGGAFLLRSVVAIEQVGASPAATSALLAIALHGQGPETRTFHEASRVLERTGADLVPELIQALENGDRVVRERAFRFLRAPVDLRMVPVLCSLLESEEWSRLSAGMLGSIGPPALPSLAALLDGESAEGRKGAAMAVRSMGGTASPLIPALVRTLKDTRHGVRAEAIQALGSFGNAGRSDVRKALEAALIEEKDEELSEYMRWALGMLVE